VPTALSWAVAEFVTRPAIKGCRVSRLASAGIFQLFFAGLLVGLAFGQTSHHQNQNSTFYKEVLPILQGHCQVCHRVGGIAPMGFARYDETRRYAAAIGLAAEKRTMPPWFAVPGIGKFSNDPSLSEEEIAALAAWAKSGAPAGNPSDAPAKRIWSGRWTIAEPEMVMKMTEAVKIPASGEVDYTYEIVPTNFKAGRWVQGSEVLPGMPENVHHAVVYVRPPGSPWLKHAPVGKPFTAETLATEEDRRDAMWTDSDILLVYAPGSTPDNWPEGMAKYVPAGADLVFQMHYTTNGKAGTDGTQIGLRFAKEEPKQRVLTLQLTNDHFVIPPGVPDYRVEAWGRLPNDALLLSFFPHMHLRGKRFEYNIVHKDKSVETLLRVNYHFHWQMSYRLAEPLALKAGTELQAVAWFDNSRGNPHNPDPDAAVRWGEQTSDEMMVGFFDVAVGKDFDKWKFFERGAGQAVTPSSQKEQH
jgi:mono/diheme cytochrome c family protein